MYIRALKPDEQAGIEAGFSLLECLYPVPEKPTQHPLTYVIHIPWTNKAHSTDQQLVEFTFLIAWEQCVARFNRAFGIEADDVSRNGYCLATVAR